MSDFKVEPWMTARREDDEVLKAAKELIRLYEGIPGHVSLELITCIENLRDALNKVRS